MRYSGEPESSYASAHGHQSTLVEVLPSKAQTLRTSFGVAAITLFSFAFALDFRGTEGGSVAQILMAIMAMFTALATVPLGAPAISKPLTRLLLVTCGIIVMAYLVSVYHSVPFERSGRVMLPFCIFAAGMWVAAVASSSKVLLSTLVSAMVAAGLVSVMFRYFYATRIIGVSVMEMRYQLLSPVLCTLIAYVCATIFYSTNVAWHSIAILMGTTLTMVLSVTRSYVITLAFCVIAVVLVVGRISSRNSVHSIFRKWRRIGILCLAAGGLLGLGAAYMLRPDVIEQWVLRLYSGRVMTISGYDVNYISRVAEMEGIWESLATSPGSLLIGKGFGNTYSWSFDYEGEVRSISRDMVYAMFEPQWVAGHSPFSYALFCGGAIGLLWQLSIFVWPLAHGFKTMVQLRAVQDAFILRVFCFAYISVALYLSQSFTANPFGERMSGQYLGVAIGLVLCCRARRR